MRFYLIAFYASIDQSRGNNTSAQGVRVRINLINGHSVVFLQIYDKLSCFPKVESLYKSLKFRWLDGISNLIRNCEIRQLVVFLQNRCRIFSC